LNSANETLKQYLPESVTAYLPGAAPRTAAAKSKGPTGGVGSLPGTPNEEGVAILPEERQQSARSNAATLPSHEGRDEDLGKTGGVGALPGSRSETSVAKTPEERLRGKNNEIGGSSLRNEIGRDIATQPQADEATRNLSTSGAKLAAAPVPPSKNAEMMGVPLAPTVREPLYDPDPTSKTTTLAQKGTGTEASRAHGHHTQGHHTQGQRTQGQGLAAGDLAESLHRNQKPHQSQPTDPTSSSKAAPSAPTVNTTDASAPKRTGDHSTSVPANTGVSPESAGQGESPTKTSFMKRVKGEAMVLQGKLEKKDAKVEEGQKIKHGKV
jgi:hypothetical protein